MTAVTSILLLRSHVYWHGELERKDAGDRNKTSRIGDVALVAKATAAALILIFDLSIVVFGGLVATGLVQLG